MKKTNLFIILVLVLALALSACTSKDNGNVDNNHIIMPPMLIAVI